MPLYFFSTRDDGHDVHDATGLDFPDLHGVKLQAARSLAELALDVLPGVDRRTLSVDVRDDQGEAVMTADLIFEARFVMAQK